MSKNISNKLLAICFIAGATIAGGILGGVYLIANNNKESSVKIFSKPDLQFFSKDNGPIIKQLTTDGDDFWLNDDEMDALIEKINNELGYGPEIYKLRSISIANEEIIGNNSNGVYYPSLDMMYINVDNFKKIIGNYFNYNPELLKKIKVELIFGTIYHEYGHHIANTYLTNEIEDAKRDKDIFIEEKSRNGDTIRKESTWNKNFVEEFKTYLNYKDWKGKKYDFNIDIEYETGTEKGSEKNKYKSIGSIYSQQDLFEYSNGREKYDFKELKGVNYIFSSKFKPGVFNKIPIEDISYYYSMDELFARKYQQLNQIYNPLEKRKFSAMGYIWRENMKIPGTTDLLTNSLLYQAGIFYPDLNENRRLREFSTAPLLFQDHTISHRYLYDAPFDNHKFNFEDTDGKNFKLKDHHVDLYNLMDRFMGHNNGADISLIWPKNILEPAGPGRISVSQKEQNLFKFGGFVKTDNYKKIGYFENENDPNSFKIISEIILNDYTYKYKDSLGATSHVPLDPNKENFFYTTKDFVEFKDEFLGKKLYFEKVDGSHEALTTIRSGENTGQNSSYHHHFYDILKNDKKYSFVKDSSNDSVYLFKEIL